MILVRHAQPEIDPAVPAVEWRLSAAGRRQCVALAEELARLDPDAIYASPEPKARETAELLGAALELAITELPDLREHDRRGTGFFASEQEFERHVLQLFRRPDEVVFGVESAAECLVRFRGAIAEVRSRRERQPLVVTHGTAMALFLASETGHDAEQLWRSMRPAYYTVLEPRIEG